MFTAKKVQIENNINNAIASDQENESRISHFWYELFIASYEVKNTIHTHQKLIVSRWIFKLEMYIPDH